MPLQQWHARAWQLSRLKHHKGSAKTSKSDSFGRSGASNGNARLRVVVPLFRMCVASCVVDATPPNTPLRRINGDSLAMRQVRLCVDLLRLDVCPLSRFGMKWQYACDVRYISQLASTVTFYTFIYCFELVVIRPPTRSYMIGMINNCLLLRLQRRTTKHSIEEKTYEETRCSG